MAKQDDILNDAKDAFQIVQEHENRFREDAHFDLRFYNGEQWPETLQCEREAEGRPCLSINRLPAIVRQVSNDLRQNRPSIAVHPMDSDSDPATAEIMTGLIRQIEQQSSADAAYDTAAEHAVIMGRGYIRLNTKYADDDTFDQDIVIERVADPLSIYGDPDSTAVDSSDWNSAFVMDTMTSDAFKKRYKGADAIDWDFDYKDCGAEWFDGEHVSVAEYWTREQAERAIVILDDGTIMDENDYATNKALFDALGRKVINERTVSTHKVKQRILTGAEVLEERDWGGKYIPIVPVYGAEIFIKGKRHLKGMVRDVIDAQRNFLYWRSAATEQVALAPLAPWIGAEGAFEADPEKWATANREPHAFLEYRIVGADGQQIPAPQRVDPAQVSAAALQEAMNASDDLKSVTGIFDASQGAPSNETSGVAITNRQREGDVGQFHYADNLSRAIRHTGRIIIDLIPRVYSTSRILRIIGKDEIARLVPVNQPVVQGPNGQPMPHPQPAPNLTPLYDLTAGKYDLTVSAGPSYTTQRQESADQMMQFIQAVPSAAPLIGDLLAKNLDWLGADEIAQRLKAAMPQPSDPQSQQLQQQNGQLTQQLQLVSSQLQLAEIKIAGLQADQTIKAQQAKIAAYEAETERLQIESEISMNLAKAGGVTPAGSAQGAALMAGITPPVQMAPVPPVAPAPPMSQPGLPPRPMPPAGPAPISMNPPRPIPPRPMGQGGPQFVPPRPPMPPVPPQIQPR